jgi:beta-N-acetylhexosaminidase
MKLITQRMVIIFLLVSLLTGCGTTGGLKEDDSGIIYPDGNASNVSDDNKNVQKDEQGPKSGDTGRDDENSPDASEPENDHAGEGADIIAALLKGMTLDAKIGQMFIIGFDGTVMDNELEDMLKTRAPGGVILFRRNSESTEQLLELINSIKKVNSGKIPLFISVDEEGGRVSRMPDSLSDIPSAAAIGENGDISVTYEVGTLIAEEISSFGINMDFAPVLDIFSNPDNTVIGDRSFGNTAQAVTEHGIEMMKGIRDKGVIPVVKHFPGHGDTVADSHKELPVVEYDMSRLAGFELVPFKKAIDEDADAVMVAHLLMKGIDPEKPATMSKAVISDLLRDQMGFKGVVVTDDMTMSAITENYDIGEAAVSSVVAGSDIILVCHDYDKEKMAIEAVRSAVESGYIKEARIDESVERILRLKAKYGLEDRIIDSVDTDGLNKKIDGQLAKWYNR